VISGLEFRVLDVEELVGVLTGDGVEGAVLGDVLVEVGVDAGKGLGLAGGGVVEGLGGAGLDDGYGVNPVGAIRLGEELALTAHPTLGDEVRFARVKAGQAPREPFGVGLDLQVLVLVRQDLGELGEAVVMGCSVA